MSPRGWEYAFVRFEWRRRRVSRDDPEFRKLYLSAEHVLLANCADRLPPYYAERLGMLESELGHLGISPAQATRIIEHHLTSARGLSGPVVDRLLGRTPEPLAGPSRQ